MNEIKRLRRGIERRVNRLWLSLGSDVECPICGWTGRRFLPGGVTVRRPGRKCARCGSIERYRQLWLYLRDRTTFFSGRHRVLDLAPPPYFRRAVRLEPGLDYLTADLDAPDVDVHADITALPFQDGAFDFILCFHVLEHVPDDASGMRELYRCLAPGGTAILQVPIRGATTFQDPTATTDQYEALYGQSDHVRYYGLDFQDRLREAGFAVETVDVRAFFGEAAVKRHGLGGDDRFLFVCRHPAT